MRSIFAGMIAPAFSIGSASGGATADGVGTTFAVPAPPVGGGQENEIVAEYTEQVAPATVGVDIEAGNNVDANEDLVAPLETLATIVSTAGELSVRQKTGRYRFVRLNLTLLSGASAEVTGKIGM